ncbi:MAG: tetratricopeptide repeat protein [bacterium]|nr:tetratricopeptide repeat protein [bacterium]
MKKISIYIIFFSMCLSLLYADYTDFIKEGILLLNQKRISESIKAFEKARDMKPSDPYAYFYLGEAYYAIGKKKEALDNYNKAVEIDNTNPDFYYSIANFYLSEGNYEEAIKSLDKVIEIAPASIKGKSARKLKEEIQRQLENREMLQKWAKMEEEIKKQKEEKKEEQKQEPFPGPPGAAVLPPEFTGMIPGEATGVKEEKLPVEQLVKRIKFGTATTRQNASTLLLAYEQSELLKVVPDIIEIIKQNNEPAIRKNLILALGKTETPDSIDTILKIIQDKNELYDIKITALDSISKIKSESVIVTLRNTLKSILDKRENERIEAQKNIKDITSKLETLEAQKIALNMQLTQEEQKRNEIMQKLQMSDLPSEFAVPPGIPQPGGNKSLSIQEIQKIRNEMLKTETSINKKREDLAKTDQQIIELQQQKSRYEALLQAREQKRTDIVVTTSSTPVTALAPRTGVPVGPPGFETGMPTEIARYEETPEDKNEVVFALKLIRTLGKMRDRQGLSIIKKGWEEFGVENEQIYYLLTLARLGDFTGIQTLISRLGQDYPNGEVELREEIDLRKGIIEILGEYITQKPDPQLQGLIEFLSEEGIYPDIKEMASSVLVSITKNPGK